MDLKLGLLIFHALTVDEDEIRSACGSWTIGRILFSETRKLAEFIKYLTLYDGADV